MSFDHKELEVLLQSVKDAQKKHKQFISDFLVEMGMRAIAQTKTLTPVDTGNLRNRWELSQVFRRGSELYVVLLNPAEYASHVEDGHMQQSRFVPGEWIGKEFKYDPNSKTGMVLKNKWVKGKHMARISINKIDKEIPRRYEKAMKQFLSGLGVGD